MKEDRETRYHPDTLEPVEKPEDGRGLISPVWDPRGQIRQLRNKYNKELTDWNNALTLEQVFERYKEMRTFLVDLRDYINTGMNKNDLKTLINQHLKK